MKNKEKSNSCEELNGCCLNDSGCCGKMEKDHHDDDGCCCHAHHGGAHSGIECSCGCGEEGGEHEGFPKKIWIAALLFVPALLLEHIPALNGASPLFKTAYIALYIAAYIVCGHDVLLAAVKNIIRGRFFCEQFLMSVASIGALCMGESGEAVAVMLFYQLGEFFQDFAVDKSRDAISELMSIRPDKAFVLRNGRAVESDPAKVAIGEIIEVKPGERVPLDGFVESGSSFVDTSALTGESLPRAVNPGDGILAGTVNRDGVLTIRVTKPYGQSAVSRILELTEKATAVKANSEKFISRFARVYTPIVCFAALAVAVLPPLVLPLIPAASAVDASWQTWIYRGLLFLVVSCPCALVISVPLSFFSGIGAAGRRGILVKGSSYIEVLAAVRTAVFDKTGTLTKGVFEVAEINPAAAGGLSRDELIEVAAHAESLSNHPVSKSLKSAHSCPRCLDGRRQISGMKELSGLGVSVVVDGKQVLAGNPRLMTDQEVSGFDSASAGNSGTTVHIAVDGIYCGHIVISDCVKEDSAAALQALKDEGVSRNVMLTGDSAAAAGAVAAELGIDTVYSGLLPEDKVNRLESLLGGDGKLMYVGDGINDSPVLARADVGVAMGALGSDAAIEAADVVIMDDKLSKLAEAVSISKKTVGIVRENIVFSLGVKFAIMVLGTLGIAGMWAAVFGDVGVTVLAVLNALRLLADKKKAQPEPRL